MFRSLLFIPLLVSISFNTFADEVQRREANNGNIILQDIPEVPQSVVDDLNRFQNIRGASLRGWLPDGKGIYITTRFGEVSQLHRVDIPGGARRQLTFFDEPIGSSTRQPDGSEIAFLMDSGGNESAQVFLLDPKSAEYRLISDGTSRNGSVVWHPDGKHVACQSTRRNGSSNDVWLIDTESPDMAELLLKSPDGTWWGPTQFDSAGKRLLVQQYVSAVDSRIHLVDVAAKTSQQLLGSSEKPSRNLLSNDSGFDKDNSGFYYVTDQSGDFAQLAHYNMASRRTEMVSADIKWDVEDFVLNEDRTRGAFVVNADGLSKLYLLNPSNNQYREVAGVPIGVMGSLSFSPAAKPQSAQLAFTLSTSQTPSDVFVLELADSPTEHGELVRWTYSEVGGLDTDAFCEPKLIHYPTFDKATSTSNEPRMIPAFVYQPKGTGPFPVVISIHGGPESQFRPSFASRFQLWAEKLGAVVIAPNVRGSSGYGKEYVMMDNGFKREDSVKDIGSLLDWIETQPHLDSKRVAVYGGSYGGYMVLASAVHYSDRLKAAIDVVGISNFVTFLKNTQDYRRDLRRVEYGDERDPAMHDHLQKISPTNNVEKIRTPMLVVQGQNDPRVPVTEAEQIVAALRKQGNKVWYMNALNEGHGYRKKENRDLYSQVIVMFLKKHLIGE